MSANIALLVSSVYTDPYLVLAFIFIIMPATFPNVSFYTIQTIWTMYQVIISQFRLNYLNQIPVANGVKFTIYNCEFFFKSLVTHLSIISASLLINCSIFLFEPMFSINKPFFDFLI